MRIIKFRVWDGKKYHYPEATKDEANHYLQFGSEGFWLFNEQGKMITAFDVGGICEQYAGLKDKNGKECYEGDLVKHPSTKYLFKVVFRKAAFRLQSLNPDLLKNNISAEISHIEFSEIIGNIHTQK